MHIVKTNNIIVDKRALKTVPPMERRSDREINRNYDLKSSKYVVFLVVGPQLNI